LPDIKFDISYAHGSYDVTLIQNIFSVLPQSNYAHADYNYSDDSLESMATYKIDNNSVKVGLQLTRRDFTNRTLVSYDIQAGALQNFYLDSFRGIENARGIFVEDEYKPTKDVI